MIKKIEVGEILEIDGREWVLIKTKVGGSDQQRPDLITLKGLIKNINRKPYYKGKVFKKKIPRFTKKQIKEMNLIKLSNVRRFKK